MNTRKRISTVFLIAISLTLHPSTFYPAFADAGLPPVVETTFPNGLRLLVLERHHSPTIAFRVAYDVGSVDDLPGQSGLAHLFEHMAFKGTKTMNSKDYAREAPLLAKVERAAEALLAEEARPAPDPKKLEALKAGLDRAQAAADALMEKDEYEKILTEKGAAHFNAHTAGDYTMYEVSLPANQLELWLAMESDRFQNPVLREFYRERDVVMEERRMNYESAPDGKLWENFMTHAFTAHPYHRTGIGWMSDLKRLTAQNARDFFAAHYGPAKTVIAIVGDVDAKKTVALARKYFATIPRGRTESRHLSEEPPQEGERRVEVRFQAQPKVAIGWHKPAVGHPDQAVYEVIAQLLGLDEGGGIGRTTRFYKNLVEGKRVAQSVDMDIRWPGQKYPGLAIVWGLPRAPHTTAELEQAVYEELEKLKTGPVPAEELEKVRNQLEARLVEKMESNEEMAEDLARFLVVTGDWRYPWKLKDALARVTEADIRRVAAATFTKDNRTVATLLPPEK